MVSGLSEESSRAQVRAFSDRGNRALILFANCLAWRMVAKHSIATTITRLLLADLLRHYSLYSYLIL